MIGIFKGKDGSVGFHTGQVYNIKSSVAFGYIWITDINTGMKCSYTTIEKVLQNWELRE